MTILEAKELMPSMAEMVSELNAIRVEHKHWESGSTGELLSTDYLFDLFCAVQSEVFEIIDKLNKESFSRYHDARIKAEIITDLKRENERLLCRISELLAEVSSLKRKNQDIASTCERLKMIIDK